MITQDQAAAVTAFLRDCQALAAQNFYSGKPDQAAAWVMRRISSLLAYHAAGANPDDAVAACRSSQFSPLRMGIAK